MNQANRVIVNTLAQYIKIICVIVLSLYSTRIVFRELGSDDFGLYSLVGSVLAFLSFLNTTIIRSTQRFLSYYMGRDDFEYQKKVFFNSVLLNFLISLFTFVVIILLEPLLFDGFINVSQEKLYTARILYRLIGVSVIFTINVSPFNAVFVSHENIVFSSLVYIFIAVLRLLAAFVLAFINEDKLLWYGLFMMVISALDFAINFIVARIKYYECRNMMMKANFDKNLMFQILSFAWWNLYGTLCVMGRNQGYAFVINKFMALSANAAYGVANQISGQINNFVYSLSNAISPIITRSEGANDSLKMIFLATISSKVSILMFAIIAFPILFEIESILQLWLGSVPDFTVPFVVSIVVASICDSYAVGFRTAIQAIGDIKQFSIWVYTIKVISIPISVILFYLNVDSKLVFIPYVVTELIGTVVTIFFYCRLTKTSVYLQFIDAIKSLLIPLSAPLITVCVIHEVLSDSLLKILISIFASFVTTSVFAYLFTLGKREKNIFISVVLKFVR